MFQRHLTVTFFSIATGFDEEISSNRQQAEAALNKSDSIQQNIDEANAKTDAAKASLGQATTIATSASEKAYQAQDTAEDVQAVC